MKCILWGNASVNMFSQVSVSGDFSEPLGNRTPPPSVVLQEWHFTTTCSRMWQGLAFRRPCNWVLSHKFSPWSLELDVCVRVPVGLQPDFLQSDGKKVECLWDPSLKLQTRDVHAWPPFYWKGVLLYWVVMPRICLELCCLKTLLYCSWPLEWGAQCLSCLLDMAARFLNDSVDRTAL